MFKMFKLLFMYFWYVDILLCYIEVKVVVTGLSDYSILAKSLAKIEKKTEVLKW